MTVEKAKAKCAEFNEELVNLRERMEAYQEAIDYEVTEDSSEDLEDIGNDLKDAISDLNDAESDMDCISKR